MQENINGAERARPTITEVGERYARHPMSALETYEFFSQTDDFRAETKAAFIAAALAGHTPETPGFDYPNIDVDQLVQWRDELTAMLQDAVELIAGIRAAATPNADTTPEEAALILRENITNRLHEVGLMLLTKMQQETKPTHPNYKLVSYQLGQNLREIYGVPEPEHWRGILGHRLAKLAAIETRSDVPQPVAEAWEFLRTHLPQDLPIVKPYQPKPETIAWYADQLRQRIGPACEAVLAAIDAGDITLDATDQKLDAPNIIKATRLALSAYGAPDWDVQETAKSNIDTSQAKKTIFVPRTRRMSLEEFFGVMVGHEIDEHVARRNNGDATGEVVLGGTGAPGYLSWEEGNGKANEALLKGKVSTAASANAFYLAGGLALGLDQPDSTGRNYGQTFDILWRLELVDKLVNNRLDPDNIVHVTRDLMDKMTKRLDRLFRGTDGRVPGVVFTKDALTYYLGQVQVWRKWDRDMQLHPDERVREHQLERSAKIDPTRPDHRRVAKRALAAAA